MDGVMEVLSGRERRRRWSVTEKLRIVAETQEAGARISGVAARHGICESLVFTWRRQVREGVLVAPEMAAFMPVRMFEASEPAPTVVTHPSSQALTSPRPSSGLIEIEL